MKNKKLSFNIADNNVYNKNHLDTQVWYCTISIILLNLFCNVNYMKFLEIFVNELILIVKYVT